MTSDKHAVLMESLRDPEYRYAFLDEHISQGLAFQIRALRDKNEWTQQQLADRTGQRQEAISQLENPDYGRYSLTTLRKLAAAFNVALIVHFGPFSELVDWTLNLSQQKLAPADYAEEMQSLRWAGLSVVSGAPAPITLFSAADNMGGNTPVVLYSRLSEDSANSSSARVGKPSDRELTLATV